MKRYLWARSHSASRVLWISLVGFVVFVPTIVPASPTTLNPSCCMVTISSCTWVTESTSSNLCPSVVVCHSVCLSPYLEWQPITIRIVHQARRYVGQWLQESSNIDFLSGRRYPVHNYVIPIIAGPAYFNLLTRVSHPFTDGEVWFIPVSDVIIFRRIWVCLEFYRIAFSTIHLILNRFKNEVERCALRETNHRAAKRWWLRLSWSAVVKEGAA